MLGPFLLASVICRMEDGPSLVANDDDYSSVVYLIAKQIFVPIFLISSLRL